MRQNRPLALVYAVLFVAATARSGYQLATKADKALLAYSLSALAALVYGVGAFCFHRMSDQTRRVAVAVCTFELAGVVLVGAFSLLEKKRFPDPTVWSEFGAGYGFVPLVLPIVGLIALRRGLDRGTASD